MPNGLLERYCGAAGRYAAGEPTGNRRGSKGCRTRKGRRLPALDSKPGQAKGVELAARHQTCVDEPAWWFPNPQQLYAATISPVRSADGADGSRTKASVADVMRLFHGIMIPPAQPPTAGKRCRPSADRKRQLARTDPAFSREGVLRKLSTRRRPRHFPPRFCVSRAGARRGVSARFRALPDRRRNSRCRRGRPAPGHVLAVPALPEGPQRHSTSGHSRLRIDAGARLLKNKDRHECRVKRGRPARRTSRLTSGSSI